MRRVALLLAAAALAACRAESRSDATGDAKLSLDGYKVVNGDKQFMGTLSCKLPANQKLSCSIPGSKRVNDWVFTIDGKRMTGTLYVDKERTVFRRISVAKK